MSQRLESLCRGTVALACAVGLLASGRAPDGSDEPTLEETRLSMSKWIETQQIISKERNDWQQGKEILNSRLELVRTDGQLYVTIAGATLNGTLTVRLLISIGVASLDPESSSG